MQSLSRVENLLGDLKRSRVKRLHNPNLLAPTIMAIRDALESVDKGKCIDDKLDVIERDLRLLAVV